MDRSIVLRNLPKTSGPKQIFRTDSSGTGTYQLVGVVNNGAQGTFVDGLADEERSDTRLTRQFLRSTATLRSYVVSLKNVSAIRPPATSVVTPGDATDDVQYQRPVFTPLTRNGF